MSTLNSTLSLSSCTGICISNFSRSAFLDSLFLFGLPGLLAFLAALRSAARYDFRSSLFPSIVLADWADSASSVGPAGDSAERLFEKYLTFLLPLHWGTILFVLSIIGCFTAVIMINIDFLFGISVCYCLLQALLLSLTFLYWRGCEWRFSRSVRLSLLFSFCLFLAFEIARLFYSTPYSFIGLSSVCLSINLIPLVQFVYYLRAYKSIGVSEYLGCSTSLIQDIKKRHEELASAESSEPAGIMAIRAATVNNESHGVGQAAVTKRALKHKMSAGKAALLYLLSLGSLAAYAVILNFTGFGSQGYITAAAILLLDVLIFLTLYSGTSPLIASILLTCTRFFFIVFGSTYYLVGHSCMFALFGVYLTGAIMDRYCPPTTLRRHFSGARDADDGKVHHGFAFTRFDSDYGEAEDESVSNLNFSEVQSSTGSITQLLSLWLLLIAFAADIALSYFTADSSTDIISGVDKRSPVYFIGLFGVFIFLSVSLLRLTFRLYWNSCFRVTLSIAALCFVLCCSFVGLAVLYVAYVDEYIAPTCLVFVPPLLFLFTALFFNWQLNDFKFLSPPEHRSPPLVSTARGFFTFGLPKSDYFMIIGSVCEVALLAAFGGVLSLFTTPVWIGPLVCLVVFILLTSFLPAFEWFHTFRFSRSMLTSAFASLGALIGGAAALFVFALDSQLDSHSFLLLLLVFLYPTVWILLIGLYRWYDNHWQLTDFVIWSQFICGLLVVLFFFTVALVFDPYYIGLGGLLIFVALLFLTLILPALKDIYPLIYYGTYALLALFFVGFCIGVGSRDGSGFLGFTLWSAVAFISLVLLSFRLHASSPRDAISIHGEYQVLYSPTIFPIYEFHTVTGSSENPLRLINSRVAAIYGCCAVFYIWGVFAEFFITPNAVGQCFSSLGFIAALIYSAQMRYFHSQQSARLAEAVNSLDEGSERYWSAVRRAKWNATRDQLLEGLTLAVNAGANPKLGNELGASAFLSGSADDSAASELQQRAFRSMFDRLLAIEESEDYRQLLDLFELLLAKVPSANWFSPHCGLRRRSSIVNWFGDELTLRECLWLLLDLNQRGNQFFARHERYHTQLAAELIKLDRSAHYEHCLNLYAMMRERGDQRVTMQFLLRLSAQSEVRKVLDAKLSGWLNQREIALAEREKNRRIKERAQKKREMLRIMQGSGEGGIKQAEIERRKKEKQEYLQKLMESKENEEKEEQQSVSQRLASLDAQHKREIEELAKQARIKAQEEKSASDELAKEIERKRRILEKRAEQRAINREKKLRELELVRRLEEAEIKKIREEARAAMQQMQESESEARASQIRKQKFIAEEAEKFERRSSESIAKAEKEIQEKLKSLQEKKSKLSEKKKIRQAQEREAEAREAAILAKQPNASQRAAVEQARKARLAAALAAQQRDEAAERSLLADVQRLAERLKDIKREIAKERESLATKLSEQFESVKIGELAEEQDEQSEGDEKASNDPYKAAASGLRGSAAGSEPSKPRSRSVKGRNHAKSAFAALKAKEAELRAKEEARRAELEEAARKEAELAEKEKKKAEKLARAEAKLKEKQRDLDEGRFESVTARQKELAIKREQEARKLREAKARARAAKEAEAESEWRVLQAQAQQSRICTFKLTGAQPTPQQSARCLTCRLEAVCVQCQAGCHFGHELEPTQSIMPIACDCGLKQCEMMKSMEEKQLEKAIELQQSSSGAASEDPSAVLRARCAASHTKFTDPEFPANDRSLFIDPAKPHNKSWKGAKWMRISELIKSGTLFAPPPDANDIKQGRLGNCWLLSAMAVLTLKQSALLALFATTKYNEEGCYAVRFYHNGKIVNVIIDDYIPINEGKARVSPLFAQLPDSNSLWPILLEKAFAKLHGNYQSIEGGWVDSALSTLTGGMAERLSWADPKVKASLNDGSLWTLLLQYHDSGFLMGCGSPIGKSDSEADASDLGIIQSHAYSILALKLVDGHQLIRVRNPWGRKEWTGDWSDQSPLWTPRLKALVNFVSADDGAFWMDWKDFCVHFDEVYVCRFFGNSVWPCRGQLAGEWTDRSAGGCMNHSTVKFNPQFAFTPLEQRDCELAIELMQADTRGVKGKTIGEYPLIILELYENGGKAVTREKRGKMIANAGAPSQSVHIQTTIKYKANAVYTLLVCTYEPAVETQFTLKWHAKAKVRVQKFDLPEGEADLIKQAKLVEVKVEQVQMWNENEHETIQVENNEAGQKNQAEIEMPLMQDRIQSEVEVPATADLEADLTLDHLPEPQADASSPFQAEAEQPMDAELDLSADLPSEKPKSKPKRKKITKTNQTIIEEAEPIIASQAESDPSDEAPAADFGGEFEL